MRYIISTTVFLSCFILLCQSAYGQNEHQESPEEHHEARHKHMLSVMLLHANVSKGVKNGENQWLTLPAWAINYNYNINPNWQIGLHTDIIIEEFQVQSKSSNDSVIKRTSPVSVLAAASYKPLHFLAIILGAGVEYEDEHTFTLIRLGVEPSIAISEKWEVVFTTAYDIKIDAYNDWNIGIGMARLF